MKNITRKHFKSIPVITVFALLLTAEIKTFGIEGLQISVQCPDVILSWPSNPGDTYIIQWRASLSTNTPWVTLTNSLPADSTTNFTVFTDSGRITNCGSVGNNDMMIMNITTAVSADISADDEMKAYAIQIGQPLVRKADGSGPLLPLGLYWPGFDLSSFVIIDPLTGESVSGAGYVVSDPSITMQAQFNGIHALDDQSDDETDSTNSPPADPGFYQVVKMGATLYGLTDGMTISGVLQLPVEVAELSGQLTTVTLQDSGDPIASTLHFAPFERPVPLVTFDTTLMTNGVHNISVYTQCTDPGDGTEDGSQIIYEATSPPVSVTVSNEISFPNWVPEFGELGNSLVVNAQTTDTNADWYLDVYGSQYNYIGTMGGTTPDGNIYVVWDLVGPPPDYTLYTDNTFEFVLSTAMGSQLLASAAVPPIYRITDPWAGPGDWVVVNQQAWDTFVGHDMLDTEADEFVQTAQGLGLNVRPITSGGTSYRIEFGPNNGNVPGEWAAFRSALYNTNSRNLFYLGHGSPAGLGYNQTTTNRSIMATEIATNLATIPAGLTNKHKYRFVCVDGCSTASGTLPESFGIIHKENVDGGYYADASLRPSAYAGWNDDKAGGFVNSINVSHVYYFQHFQYAWTSGYGVRAAFDYAAGQPDVTFLSTSQMKVFGDATLGVNAFNR